MKRFLMTALWLGIFALVTVAAQSAGPNVAATTEGYHHLLMLDQKEAVEHAKTLHFYVQRHKGDLDHVVLMKHVDELGRNLQGMQDEYLKIEEVTKKDAPAAKPLEGVQEHQLKAKAAFEQLKMEADKDAPDATKLMYQSAAIYDALKTASAQHHKNMGKMGVREPSEPVR